MAEREGKMRRLKIDWQSDLGQSGGGTCLGCRPEEQGSEGLPYADYAGLIAPKSLSERWGVVRIVKDHFPPEVSFECHNHVLFKCLTERLADHYVLPTRFVLKVVQRCSESRFPCPSFQRREGPVEVRTNEMLIKPCRLAP